MRYFLAVAFALPFFIHGMRETVDVGAMVNYNAHHGIWDGSDVSLKSPPVAEQSNMKVGPFPAFVSLSFKNDEGKVSICGGTLYRRKFIITAAHCAQKSPDVFNLHAHLNPYRNPFIVQSLTMKRDEYRKLVFDETLTGNVEVGRDNDPYPWDIWLQAFPDAAKFRKDIFDHGLGVPLMVKRPVNGSASNYGILHKRWEKNPLSRYHGDVAIIPLDSAPFEESSEVWSFFDVALERDVLPAHSTIYGNGFTAPDKSLCGFGPTKMACVLQEKRVDLLSHDECMEKVLHEFTNHLEHINRETDDQLELQVADHPRVKDGSLNSTVMVRIIRKLFLSLQAYFAGALQQKKNMLPSVIQQIRDLGSSRAFDIEDLDDGRQICIMSAARSGSVQVGDSGGPLVGDNGKLVGVSSWAYGIKDGNMITSFNKDMVRMPAFYAAMPYFGPSIDMAIDCLLEHADEEKCGDVLA